MKWSADSHLETHPRERDYKCKHGITFVNLGARRPAAPPRAVASSAHPSSPRGDRSPRPPAAVRGWKPAPPRRPPPRAATRPPPAAARSARRRRADGPTAGRTGGPRGGGKGGGAGRAVRGWAAGGRGLVRGRGLGAQLLAARGAGTAAGRRAPATLLGITQNLFLIVCALLNRRSVSF